MDKQLTITPSERDFEKVKATLKEALSLFDSGGWSECSPNEIIEMRFAHLIAAERASLPESIEREIKSVLQDLVIPLGAHRYRLEKALTELKAWQSGK